MQHPEQSASTPRSEMKNLPQGQTISGQDVPQQYSINQDFVSATVPPNNSAAQKLTPTVNAGTVVGPGTVAPPGYEIIFDRPSMAYRLVPISDRPRRPPYRLSATATAPATSRRLVQPMVQPVVQQVSDAMTDLVLVPNKRRHSDIQDASALRDAELEIVKRFKADLAKFDEMFEQEKVKLDLHGDGAAQVEKGQTAVREVGEVEQLEESVKEQKEVVDMAKSFATTEDEVASGLNEDGDGNQEVWTGRLQDIPSVFPEEVSEEWNRVADTPGTETGEDRFKLDSSGRSSSSTIGSKPASSSISASAGALSGEALAHSEEDIQALLVFDDEDVAEDMSEDQVEPARAPAPVNSELSKLSVTPSRVSTVSSHTASPTINDANLNPYEPDPRIRINWAKILAFPNDGNDKTRPLPDHAEYVSLERIRTMPHVRLPLDGPEANRLDDVQVILHFLHSGVVSSRDFVWADVAAWESWMTHALTNRVNAIIGPKGDDDAWLREKPKSTESKALGEVVVWAGWGRQRELKLPRNDEWIAKCREFDLGKEIALWDLAMMLMKKIEEAAKEEKKRTKTRAKTGAKTGQKTGQTQTEDKNNNIEEEQSIETL